MDSNPTDHDADDAIIDEVFDIALRLKGEGRPIDLSPWRKEHPHLRAELDEAARLASLVAVQRSLSAPEVSGYEILGELGRGAMGSVYLARQKSLGRLVALKVIGTPALLRADARERFARETRALSRLAHPNVVAVHDSIDRDDFLAYSMRWVDGKSLADLLAHLRSLGRPASVSDVRAFLGWPSAALPDSNLALFYCRLALTLARALAAVHRAGLVHRDVKPSNVLLGRDGTPFLSDFGLATDAADASLTRSGQFVGTPAYSSPEQLRGDRDAIDSRTDIYALGATLYECLSGRLPFDRGRTRAADGRDEPPVPERLRRLDSSIPRDLETIVGKAMAPEPTARYASADDFADDLERLLNLRPIAARPPAVPVRVWRLLRRNRRACAAVAAGAVLGVALSYGAALRSRHQQNVERRIERLRREARLALLDPSHAERTYVERHLGGVSGIPPVAVANLDRALALYARAFELDPDREDLEYEAEIVRAVRTLAVEPSLTLDVSRELRRACPKTAAYLLTRARGPRGTESLPVDESSSLSADADDRFRVGLVAYLLGEATLCHAAWAGFDLRAETEPFVDAARGELHLVEGNPALAYPLLLSAYRAFPEAGFLAVELADVACRLRDLEKAGRFIAEAASLSRRGPYDTLGVVKARYLVALGETGAARLAYEALMRGTPGPTAIFDYARLLEDEGDLAAAVGLYCDVVRDSTKVRHFREALSAAGRKWWGSLGFRARIHEIGVALSPWPCGHRAGTDLLLILENEDWLRSGDVGRDAAAARGFHPPQSPGDTRFPRVSRSEMTVPDPDSSLLRHTKSLQGLLFVREMVPMLRTHLTAAPRWLADAMAASFLFLDEWFADSALASLPRARFVARRVVRTTGRALSFAATALLSARTFGQGGLSPTLIATINGVAADDLAGWCVAGGRDVNGDGFLDVVYGAPGASRGGLTNSGEAVVVSIVGGAPVTLFTRGGAAPFDRLGTSVALLPDLNGDGRSEVGFGATQLGTTPGAGYVEIWSYLGTTWTLLWTGTGLAAGDTFGQALAATHDVDADAIPDVAVGAPQLNPGTGYVTILSGSNGSPIRTVQGAAAGDRFGWDVDGLGCVGPGLIPALLVGAPQFGNGGSGYAAVFDAGTGVMLTSLAGSVTIQVAPPDRHGWNVAFVGDLDADGTDEICVGAPQFDTTPFGNEGRIVVYRGSNFAQRFSVAAGSGHNSFGTSVAKGGDLDGDFVFDILAGGPSYGPVAPDIASDVGIVRVISGTTGSTVLELVGTQQDENLGFALSTAGDQNGDGYPEFLAASPYFDGASGLNGGRIQVVSTLPFPVGSSYFGAGCLGSGGCTPEISPGGGTPSSTGNDEFEIRVTGALPSAFALLMLGNPIVPSGLPLPIIPGCTLHVVPFVYWPVVTVPLGPAPCAGRAEVPLPVPNLPSLIGVTLDFQWFINDPFLLLPIPGAMSRRLHVVVL